MSNVLPRPPEWIPERELRDALLVEKLPPAVSNKNLFWINPRRYLTHSDAQLPPEDYLHHWKEIYDTFLSDDPSTLRCLSYLSFEAPGDKDIQ